MNAEISFFVGCVTFVIMMGLKIPMKRFTEMIVEDYYTGKSEEEKFILRKRMNFSIIVLNFIIATICYYIVLRLMGDSHFKWCCTLKAGAIATVIYAIYEQWVIND